MKALIFLSKRPFTAIAAAIFIAGIAWTININAQRISTDKNSQSIELNETTWVRTELFYGAGRLPHDGKIDTRWENYIDNIVTPRFPEGLTLIEGTGQWRVKPNQQPRRNRTRILILIHEDTPEKSRLVDEIRVLWKEISGQQSVLRVSQPAEVSF